VFILDSRVGRRGLNIPQQKGVDVENRKIEQKRQISGTLRWFRVFRPVSDSTPG
jgi:hypothetical protein